MPTLTAPIARHRTPQPIRNSQLPAPKCGTYVLVPPSNALLVRAIRYLAENGRASTTELAQHVFGGHAFAPLLNSLQDERLRYDGDAWSLRQPADECAFLEVLASGPNPRRHRL